eukprot:snap_masked-scaffold_22-processed-gene-3.33-mRNA-1 protein AED:1.00 eAED:1.00 QI:0/0/0/0/1/1/2/0/314
MKTGNYSAKDFIEDLNINPCRFDVLDSNCMNSFEGEPLKPFTIRSARLCDEDLINMLKNNDEFICSKDPTCRKCRKKEYEETSALSFGFLNEKISLERKNRIEKYFPGRDILVSTVNKGQLYLFLNLVCSFLNNTETDPRSLMYLIPTDEDTFYILKDFGFIVEPLGWYYLSKEKGLKIKKEYDGRANINSHNLINTLCVFAANFVIKLNKNVLILDVDIVFLKNPFEFLNKAVYRRDVVGMYSPREDQYGYMNSGFLYFRSTKTSKILLQSYENLSYIKKRSDQQLWNTILRHYKMQQVQQRILPRLCGKAPL